MSADGDLSRTVEDAISALKAQCEKMSEEDIFVSAEDMLTFIEDAVLVIKQAQRENIDRLWGRGEVSHERLVELKRQRDAASEALERLNDGVTFEAAR